MPLPGPVHDTGRIVARSAGVYAGPTTAGTRPGGPIAAARAVMQKLGREGYLELAETNIETTEELTERAGAIGGLEVVTDPHTTSFALASTDPDLDVHEVHANVTERDWVIGRQQEPRSVHVSVMYHHRDVVGEFVADLEGVVAAARAAEREHHLAPMYGMKGEMAEEGDFAELARNLLDAVAYQIE